MTTNTSRQPVDLDAFTVDAADRAVPRPNAAKSDPLAELARIVGQDDPFRALLEAQSGTRAAHAARIEPAFAPSAPALRGSLPVDETPADAFDRYLAEADRDATRDEEVFEEAPPVAEPMPERPRGRRRLMSVGLGLGVCVMAVAGGLTWKSMRGTRGADGQPVMVMADKTPLKVAPQDAGGVEIPDQNKQIYDRAAKDGQVRIVNREEQPLDVRQAARAAAPASSNALTDSLGEPRRVRTVAVRPEGAPFARNADAQAAAQAPAQAASQAGPPTMVLPDVVSGGAPAAAPRATRAAQVPVAPAPTAPAPATTGPATLAAATPPVAPTRPRPAVQRLAAATPLASAGEADAPLTTAAAVTQASAPATGGFAVQLAVRPSEKEARAAFKQLQDRFGDELQGRPPLIRQAEVNGKTVFRIRVGPLARDDANGLCTKLKGAGGQCFVATN